MCPDPSWRLLYLSPYAYRVDANVSGLEQLLKPVCISPVSTEDVKWLEAVSNCRSLGARVLSQDDIVYNKYLDGPKYDNIHYLHVGSK